MRYEQRVAQIQESLGEQRLVFFGTRGADARPLLPFSSFTHAVCLIAPLDSLSVKEECLESRTKRRVDLNRYDVDCDSSAFIRGLVQFLREALDGSAAIVPYRPSALLTAAWFPRAEHVRYLGVFHELQASLEHKPWVESALGKSGIRVLPWRYYADEDQVLIREAAAHRPLVVRANRSSGGAGITIVETPDDVPARWPKHEDGFLAAAPYLTPSLPLNVNGCVFRDGTITLHAPSVQLIGLGRCTNRNLGYCGNDFVAPADIDEAILSGFELIARNVGMWLHQRGFLGAFGIDALVHEGEVLLVELNPRFQGSTAMAAHIARELDSPDVVLDHIAAHLGLAAPPQLPVALQARRCQPISRVICYNTSAKPVRVRPIGLDFLPNDILLTPSPEIAVDPEGILCEVQFNHAITIDGTSLTPEAEAVLDVIERHLRPSPA